MKLRLIFSKIPHIFNLTGNLLESVSLGSAYFAGRIMYRKSTVLITGQHNEMSGRGKASCKRPLITMERAVGPHPLTAMIVSEP